MTRGPLPSASTLTSASTLALRESIEQALARMRAKVELRKNSVEGRNIHSGNLERVKIDGEINIATHHVNTAIEHHLVGHLSKSRTLLASELISMRNQPSERAILVDPLRRKAVTDPRNARNVVGSLTTNCREIRVLARSDLIFLQHGLCRHMFEVREVITRVENRHVVVNKLERVTVARKHEGLVAVKLTLGGQSCDHIIALIAGHFDVGDGQSMEHALNQRQLAQQFLRCGSTGSFITTEHHITEGAAFHIKSDSEVSWLFFAAHIREHAHKAVYRVGCLAFTVGEIIGVVGVPSAEGERMAVNHKKAAFRVGNLGNLRNTGLQLLQTPVFFLSDGLGDTFGNLVVGHFLWLALPCCCRE